MKKMVALLLAFVLVISSCAVAFAGKTYRYGDEGNAIKTIQKRLRVYHYYDGEINGKFNKATLNAVDEFQKYNGLKVDGVVGDETMAKLKSSTAVKAPVTKNNQTTYDVRNIQKRLKFHGYFTGSIDGVYGKETIAAVRAFQYAAGLKVDGAVGKETWEMLNADKIVIKVPDASFTKIRLGSEGDFVKKVQLALADKGYYNGNKSGVFDQTMADAVKEFQKNNGLVADGVVGTKTWAALSGSSISKSEAATAQNEAVKKAQTRLNELGWYYGEINGKYTEATVYALKAFQSATGLKADGAVGPATNAKLYASDAPKASEQQKKENVQKRGTIRPGVQGNYVKEIQTILKNKGYYNNTIDGRFQAKTIEAVQAFQTANGLKADGIVGTATWEALLK